MKEIFNCTSCLLTFTTGKDGEQNQVSYSDDSEIREDICDECRELGFGIITTEDLYHYIKANEDDVADAFGVSVKQVSELVEELEKNLTS